MGNTAGVCLSKVC